MTAGDALAEPRPRRITSSAAGREARPPDCAARSGTSPGPRVRDSSGRCATCHQDDHSGGQTGLGTLQGGFLEKSNVQMVTELVNLIKAQRAYEMNSRAIRAGDDMLRTANDVVR